MTQYLLSVHSTETSDAAATTMTAEDIAVLYGQVDVFNEELKASGSWVFAGGLHPADTATVVSSVSGRVTITDGPFAESKEHLGGFWIIRVDGLDSAMRWAARASTLPIEVRELADSGGA